MGLPLVNTPTYPCTLPVSGKSVTFRPFLVKEEKVLMLALESGDPEAMKHAMDNIIEACTVSGLNVRDQQVADIEYLFTMIRSKSVGETSRVVLECTSCSEKNVVTVDLSGVRVDGIPETDVVKLADNLSLRMKMLTLNEVEKAKQGKTTDIEQLYGLLIASIDEIYYGDESYATADHPEQELIDFVENLNMDQFTHVRKWVEQLPVAAIDVNYVCQHCQTRNEITLQGLVNFFA